MSCLPGIKSDSHICEGLCGQYCLSPSKPPLSFSSPFFFQTQTLFLLLSSYSLYLLLLHFPNLLLIFGGDSCPIQAVFLLTLFFSGCLFYLGQTVFGNATDFSIFAANDGWIMRQSDSVQSPCSHFGSLCHIMCLFGSFSL